MTEDLKALAERFFRGVYTGNSSVVDDLAGDEIAITYPVFARIFNTSTIRGRKAVKDFVTHFSSRWADGRITIHEVIGEGPSVVLLWSFQAKNIGSLQPGEPPSQQRHSWGGITLFRFDDSGKIIAEIGEESAPGPAERYAGSDRSQAARPNEPA